MGYFEMRGRLILYWKCNYYVVCRKRKFCKIEIVKFLNLSFRQNYVIFTISPCFWTKMSAFQYLSSFILKGIEGQVEKIKINLIIKIKLSCSIISSYFIIILISHYSQRFSADFLELLFKTFEEFVKTKNLRTNSWKIRISI